MIDFRETSINIIYRIDKKNKKIVVLKPKLSDFFNCSCLANICMIIHLNRNGNEPVPIQYNHTLYNDVNLGARIEQQGKI